MYSIGEAAKLLGVSASTLRYYESQGLLPNVVRTKGGIRQFSDDDLEACRVIECLKKSMLSIQEIQTFMGMVKKGDKSLEARKALFEGRRAALAAEIAEMEQTLAVLDYKCWYYKRAVEEGTEVGVRSLPLSKVPKKHRAARTYLEGALSS